VYGIFLNKLLGVGERFQVGYDKTDGSYPGGCRYNITAGPVYNRYLTDDYLFNTWGDWMLYNKTGNPDTAIPWSWSFDFPRGDGYYEFFSRGCSEGALEPLSIVRDTMCWFVLNCPPSYVPLVVGHSMLPLYVLSLGGCGVVGFLFIAGRRRRKKQKG
jgi:hypothetical protein